LELCKFVAKAVYSIVKRGSDASVFSGKNYLQIASVVELPIFLIVEKADRIEVVACGYSRKQG
jgi:GTPase